MQLMGHAGVETPLRYVQVTAQDADIEQARAVAQFIRPVPGCVS